MEHFGLNKPSSLGRQRPDVIGYDPKANKMILVENVSPKTQTPSQMTAKLKLMQAELQKANPKLIIDILVH